MANLFQPKRVFVPGLLSDEGLAAQVKELTSAQKSAAEAAPPNTSAVEFADQVATMQAGKLGKVVDQKTRLAAQDAKSDKIGSDIAGAAATIPGVKEVSKIGLLSPERQAEEQKILLQNAEQKLQTAKDAQELGDLMRGDMQPPDWQTMTPDELVFYQQQAKKQLKPQLEALQEVGTAKTTPPKYEWWRNAAEVAARSAASVGVDALKFPADIWDLSAETITGEQNRNDFGIMMDGVDKALTKMLPGDPARSKEFVTELSSGVGSMTGSLIGGFATKTLRIGAGWGSGVLGAAVTGNQQYEDAQNFDATVTQKWIALIGGAGLGVTEAIPLDRAFFRADQATGGLVRQMLANTTATSIEEFSQELAQAVGEDLIAKYTYDEGRDLNAAPWLKQATIGAIVGGGSGAVISIIEQGGERREVDVAKTDTAQMTSAAEEAINAAQQDFDTALGDEAADLPGLGGAVEQPAADGGGAPGPAAAAPAAEAQAEVARPVVAGDAVRQIVEKAKPVKVEAPAGGETAQPDGVITYKDGGTAGISLRAVKRADGSFASERTITADDGTVTVEHLADGFQWRKGPAPVTVVTGFTSQTADAFSDATAAVAMARDMSPGSIAWAADGTQSVVLDPAVPAEQQVSVQVAPAVETPQFKAWFGQSKVVDEAGAPLVVYHGTGAQFTAFDLGAAGSRPTGTPDFGNFGVGVYATPAEFIAKAYASKNGRVLPLYAALQNPLRITVAGPEYTAEVERVARELGVTATPRWEGSGQKDRAFAEQFRERAMAAGYDGVITENADGTLGSEVVAFEPTQIKSATSNDGSFDADDPNIDSQVGTPASPDIVAQVDAIQLEPHQVSPLPDIEKGLTGPIPRVVQAAKAYAAAIGLPHRRARSYVKVDTARAARIADAYAKMKHEPNDPVVQAAYRALAEETQAQYQYVKATGLKIEAILPGQLDPYPNGPRDVLKDINAGHIWYFPTDQGFGSSEFDPTGNPLLDATDEVSDNGQPMVVNDLFRVVHDFFGHGLEGTGFGARGEENAWQSHMRLFTASAVPAMTSETRGQNSWVNYGPFGEQNRKDPRNTVYADQKTGLMPEWTWTEGVVDSTSDDVDAPVQADAAGFEAAFLAAKDASPYGAAVHAYTPAEYAKMRLFLAPDGLSGFALKGDDIVSVFSHPASGGGRARKIIDVAVANGGRTLDCFDGKLVQIYSALGFREVRRENWNDEYRPEGWKDEWGKPDVVYMEYAGADVERMVAAPLFGAGGESSQDGGLWGSEALADILRMTGTATQRMPYALEPTRPTRGVAARPAEPPSDVRLTKIADNLAKLLNLTVRHGRLVGNSSEVMGQFNRRTGVIRLRTWTDLSTLAHEAGHAINDQMAAPLDAFVNSHMAEINKIAKIYQGDLSQATGTTVRREGFAEFFRVYTMTPDYARNTWTQLTADFEALLDREDPQLKTGLNAIAAQVKAWQQLPSGRLIENTVIDGRREQGLGPAMKELRDLGFKSWMQEMVRRNIQWSTNRYAALNRLTTDLLNEGEQNRGAPIELERADDPRVLARLARNSGSRGMIEVTDGVIGYKGTQSMSKGLREAIMVSQGVDPNTTPKALDEERLHTFSAYLVARRALEEFRRYDAGEIDRQPVAFSKGDAAQAVREWEKQYPDFVKAAQIVHEYGMALWQKSYDAGLISKETYEDNLTRQFYVPLQRDMSDKREALGDSALTTRGSGPLRSIVRRFRGSDRDIIDPLSILMQKTFALEQLISENDAKKALAVLSDRVGAAGALVERIPASQLIGQEFGVREVARQLTGLEDMADTDAADLMTILGASIKSGDTISLFRSQQASAKGEPVLFFWENGKVAAIQVKDGDIGMDVVNTLNGVGRENMDKLLESVAATSTVFRTAITSWPDFLFVNFIRDQMSAWILNDVGFVPFISGIKGVADEVRQKGWAKLYNYGQGIMGGMNVAAQHTAHVDRDIRSLRAKGYIANVFGDVRSGWDFPNAVKGLARLSAVTETGTRLGLFKGAFNRAKREGLDDYQATIEASYTATDYIDFGLNGNRMMTSRRLIPFLNAQIQGFYKMVRTLGGDEVAQRKGLAFALGAYFKNINNLPLSRVEKQQLRTGRAAWLKMMSLGLISAALHYLFKDDEDYQEAGEYLRTTGWVIPTGDGQVFYIPKPFELAMVANAVERGLEAASGDGSAIDRFMRGLQLTIWPPTASPLQTLSFEVPNNIDTFTGRPIVPDYMRAMAPELQYDSYTSNLAKWMGDQFNWSPMVIDHVLGGLGASAYRDIATMTNAADPTRPSMVASDAPILRRFVRDVRKGSVSAQDFWAQASSTNGKLAQAAASYKYEVDAGNEPAANKRLAAMTADQRSFAVLMTHFKAEEKRLNPFYRATQITTLVSKMRREASSALSLGDTTVKDSTDTIPLTAKEKREVDTILSEIARREVRNTLIATGQPGWKGKQILPVEPTMDLLLSVAPEVYDELQRRWRKAKVYDAQTVYDYWPDVRDRLVQDGEFAVLSDAVAVASAGL